MKCFLTDSILAESYVLLWLSLVGRWQFGTKEGSCYKACKVGEEDAPCLSPGC